MVRGGREPPQSIEDLDHVLPSKTSAGFQGQALPGRDIHHGQHPKLLAGRQRIVHEVHGPALVGLRQRQPTRGI